MPLIGGKELFFGKNKLIDIVWIGRGGFQPGRFNQPKEKLKFDSEYDFDKANEEFKEVICLKLFCVLYSCEMEHLLVITDYVKNFR